MSSPRQRKNDINFFMIMFFVLTLGIGYLFYLIYQTVKGATSIAEEIKNKAEYEKAKSLYDETMNYLSSLDEMDLDSFKIEVHKLINQATALGFSFKGGVSGEKKVKVKYYHSVDNIGIAPIRNDYGAELSDDKMIITNRHLTPKAKEFCSNARIFVVDRDTIADIYIFLANKK